MRELWADFRYGCRLLVNNPTATVVAVLALALGIGANTAIFSVVNAVLLRPLPFPASDRLVTIRIDLERMNIHGSLFPYPETADWRQARSFESMSSFSSRTANLITKTEPERVSLWRVNADFLPMLGVKMALGRGFLTEEDEPGKGRVAILSYNLWQRRFASDAGLLGNTVVIDGTPHTVVGILPPDWKLEEDVDIYTPIALSATRSRGDEWMYAVYARLKKGVSIEQAQSEMDSVVARLEKQYPHPVKGFRARVTGLRAYLVGDTRLSLMVLLSAVSLVLLIACANVANLLLARAGARQREMAVRTALGAGRWRIVRQLLTESVALALIGGALGVVLAYWGVAAMAVLGSDRFPMLKDARLDATVLGFTMLISLLTGILFGLAPALTVSRTDVHETLKEGGRSSSEGISRNRLRSALVVSEVALALLLMIGATLLIRSLLNLQTTNPGFTTSGLLTAAIDLPDAKYSKPEQQWAFYQRLDERLRTMPGVTAAGMVSVLPLTGANQGMNLLIEGRRISGPSDVPILFFRIVTQDYFKAMQIGLKKGRFFEKQDVQGASRVLIINESMARRYWPGEDPIGKRVGTGAPDGWMSVVGVVGDIRHTSLSKVPDPEIFMPLAQNPRADMRVTVRTASDPLQFAPALRQVVRELDRDQPVSRVASMEQKLVDSVATKRFSTWLLGTFAGVALVLATIGIYGVISFSVTRRRHELGVRMAMGARSADVLRMVVVEGTVLALIGVAIGLAAAFGLTRMISSMLYGVKATEPAVFIGMSLLLIGVAALSSYLPARRASRVDPLVALRYE